MFLFLLQVKLCTERKLRIFHAAGYYYVIPIFDASNIVYSSSQEESKKGLPSEI
jgi:hypothetical protein